MVFVQPGTVVKTDKEVTLDVWVPDEKGDLILGKGKVPAGAALVIPLPKVAPLERSDKPMP